MSKGHSNRLYPSNFLYNSLEYATNLVKQASYRILTNPKSLTRAKKLIYYFINTNGIKKQPRTPPSSAGESGQRLI